MCLLSIHGSLEWRRMNRMERQFSVTRGNLNRLVAFRGMPLWDVVHMLQDQLGTESIIQWRVGEGPSTSTQAEVK